jgi:hypothetical protein
MAVWSNTDVSNQREFTDIEFAYASIPESSKHFYKVRFSAFVTSFADNFAQNWASTTVYGKPDSIETYQGTKRTVDLAWQVPSNGPREGYENMIKLETLIKMLYPMYDVQSNAINTATINKPPLLRLKFANMLQNQNGQGLLGHVNGFAFNPAMEQGMYNTKEPRQGASGIPDVGLIPKVYSMRCTFTVLHEQDLGFNKATNRFFNSGRKREESGFPYGFTKSVESIVAANKGKSVPNPPAGATKGQEKKITGA